MVTQAQGQGGAPIAEFGNNPIYTHTGLAFQHDSINKTVAISVLTGVWNGTEARLSMTSKYGDLYFYSNSECQIQLETNWNNAAGLRIVHEGITLSTITKGVSWNGTIPANTQCRLFWSFSSLEIYEENWNLYLGLLGIGLLVSGVIIGAWSFTKYPVMSFNRECIWESSIIVYCFVAAFVGFGLIMVWLTA